MSFLVGLYIDPSNQPGALIDTLDGVFSDKEAADLRCKDLNEILDDEIRDLCGDEDDEEGELEDYNGFDVSGNPYWSVTEVTDK